KCDSRTRNRTLKRTKNKLVISHDVKSHPEKVKCLFQGCGYVCQVCREIRLAVDETFYLRNQRFIAVFFSCALRDNQFFCHSECVVNSMYELRYPGIFQRPVSGKYVAVYVFSLNARSMEDGSGDTFFKRPARTENPDFIPKVSLNKAVERK